MRKKKITWSRSLASPRVNFPEKRLIHGRFHIQYLLGFLVHTDFNKVCAISDYHVGSYFAKFSNFQKLFALINNFLLLKYEHNKVRIQKKLSNTKAKRSLACHP